jgi:hypothetical protein
MRKKNRTEPRNNVAKICVRYWNGVEEVFPIREMQLGPFALRVWTPDDSQPRVIPAVNIHDIR